MKLKYRLYCRKNGTFYWQENEGIKQGSLRTKDKREAEKLVHEMNESHWQPILNLAMGRAYLSVHDPRMLTRTWQDAMNEMASHDINTTQERCARALRSKHFDPIRNKSLVEMTSEVLLGIIHRTGNSTAHYLRRLHNLALDLGWLAWPVLAKAAWPKIHCHRKRAVTVEEHAMIVAREHNLERRAFYEILWETGCSQTNAANLDATKNYRLVKQCAGLPEEKTGTG